MKWLYKNWYNGTIFSAIFITALLFLYVRPVNFPVFLVWLQMSVYLLHQFEEYVFPGGFQQFFNRKMIGSGQDKAPLTDKIVFFINVPVVFIAYPLTAILAQFTTVSVGLWTAYFSVINGLGHVGPTIKVGYNPGFLVSLCLNIPVGLYTIWYLNAHDLVGLTANVAGLLIAIAIQAALMVWGLFILRPRYQQK